MHQTSELGNPVKFMRLNTGEDIITEVVFVRDEGNFYLCINPLKVVYNLGSKPDALILAFSPWVFTTICEKQEFPIFPGDVVTIADPTLEMVKCYKQFVDRFKDKPKNQFEATTEEDMITEEEEEFLRNVLDTLDKGKRKLH